MVADGHIDSVDIRCQWHRAFDNDVTADRVWTLPESWGECDLVVSGSPGTSYRLYELPAASAN